MYFSSFGPEKLLEMLDEAGFETPESAIETQQEGETEIPYLWVLAQTSGEQATQNS
jgi:hypothetical protein